MQENIYSEMDHKTTHQFDEQPSTPMKSLDINRYSLRSEVVLKLEKKGSQNISDEVQCMKKAWTSPKQSTMHHSDRFIPQKVQANLYNLFIAAEDSTPKINVESSSNQSSTQGSSVQSLKEEQNNQIYYSLLQSQILGTQMPNENRKSGANVVVQSPPMSSKKIFRYKVEQKNTEINNLDQIMQQSLCNIKITGNQDLSTQIIEKQNRKISKKPYKILEAPNLQDDFYLNLLDWSPFNCLGVGLDTSVFIWSGHTSKVQRLVTLEDPDSVCSLAWSQRNQHIAVGNTLGEVEVYDTVKLKSIRKWSGHQGRVGSLAFNNYLLASGSRDRNILVRDVRCPNDSIQKYQGHKQEICGLKWSFDEQMLASGGNDNKLYVWSLKNQGELTHFSQHQAAVKAIGWSPHQHNLVASGGGTADRCIRFFNTSTFQQIDSIDTGSQVCNLMFSKNSNELVSTHGYSLNQIIVWDYSSLQKVATLTGHTQRVLYLSGSPCGQNIVTGAGDESLRFWQIFPSAHSKNNGLQSGHLRSENIDLR